MTTKTFTGWAILAVFILGLLLVAFGSEAHASTANSTRVDVNANDVSPLVSPITFTTDILVSDECGGLANRFIITRNVDVVIPQIATGAGDQTFNGAPEDYPAGSYQPHIYYFEEGADWATPNLTEACSSGDVFAPFEVLEIDEEASSTPTTLSTDPVQNVLLAGILMLLCAMYVRRVFFS